VALAETTANEPDHHCPVSGIPVFLPLVNQQPRYGSTDQLNEMIKSVQMKSRDDIVRCVKERYLEMCRTPFPGADVKRLCQNRDEQLDLHTDLDLYLSGVAGYSSDPDRLDQRPRGELVKAQAFLATSFFERYPEHAPLQPRIAAETTPDLHHELTLVDMNRSDLLALIGEILKSELA
jgi:hypothetical protein